MEYSKLIRIVDAVLVVCQFIAVFALHLKNSLMISDDLVGDILFFVFSVTIYLLFKIMNINIRIIRG